MYVIVFSVQACNNTQHAYRGCDRGSEIRSTVCCRYSYCMLQLCILLDDIEPRSFLVAIDVRLDELLPVSSQTHGHYSRCQKSGGM